MTGYEDIELLLQELFSDYYTAGGIYGVDKLYVFIQAELGRQLQYFVNLPVEKE